LVIAPLAITFKESIFSQGKFSFSLYKEIATDKRLLIIFGRTILIGLGTALVALLIGFVFAYILERVSLPGKKIFNFLYLTPLLIPPYIQGIGWVNFLRETGLSDSPVSKISQSFPFYINPYNVGTLVFIFSLSYFPFACIFIRAGLRGLDRRLEEAGDLIGPPRKTFTKIDLRLIFPYIFTSLVFIFILTISEYALPEFLRVHNYAFEVCYQFNAFHDFNRATALALPPTGLTLLLVIAMYKIMLDRPYISITGHYRHIYADRPSLFTIPSFIYICVILFVSIICPLSSFIKTTGSLRNISFAFSSSLSEVLLSIFLAFLGASLCTSISLPLAYLLENSRGLNKKLINILTLIPLAVPGPVIGLGLVKLWNQPQTLFIYSTFISVLLAYLARFSCYSIRIISAALKTYSPEFQEAACLITTSKIKRFFKITFPLIHPVIVITWIIAFILCIHEISAIIFLIPPGEITLPIRIESLLHQADMESLSALSLVQIIIAFIPILLIWPGIKLGALRNAQTRKYL
jgi:iron(III) transport system permease protein